MNKDKRVVVQVIADLCTAYSRERSVPNKVLMILRDSVKELALSEERSIKRMEPFKNAPGTIANYLNSVSAWEDLAAAQEALEEGELDEAAPLLVRVASTVPTTAEVQQALVKSYQKTKRKVRRD